MPTCEGYHSTGFCSYGCDGGDCPGYLVCGVIVETETKTEEEVKDNGNTL